MTIVGVVPNIPLGNISDSDSLTNPGFYMVQRPDTLPRFAYLAVRTRTNALKITPAVRDMVRRLDPDLAVTGINTLDEALADDMWYVSILGTLFIAFGLGGLFMAAVGLYSILAFSVRRRTGEIGIRMTLGATSRDIARLFLTEGLRQLVVGMILGLGLAILLARGIRVVLFDVEPADPATFVYVAVGLILVGFVASFIPARRAAGLNPVDAIRYD